MSTATQAPNPRALRRTLGIVRPHLRQHWLLALLGLGALALEVVMRVLEPWPVKFVVDAVTASLGADLAAHAEVSEASATVLVMWSLILLAIIAGRAVANFASTVAFAFVGSRVATQLRARVFAHVQRLSMRYHSTASAGDTVQRLVGDVGRLQEVAVTAGLPLVGNVMTLVVLMGVMTWIDPLMTLIALAAAIAYVFVSRRKTPKITRASRKTRRGEGTIAGAAAEALGAMRVIQAYDLHSTVGERFADGNRKALKDGVKARRLAAALERTTDVIVGAATALVLGFGGWRVMEGQITPGDLVLFLLYLKIALKPLRDLAKYTGRIARAAASGERIADLLDEEVEIRDTPFAYELPRLSGGVFFHRMTARDGHGRALFDDLTLRIPAGQQVGILGPSGAGKSSLTSYLLRLCDPDDGAVILDGHDIRGATLASLRAQISILLQESVLFSTSVRENIRYGRLEASDAAVQEAARLAGADGFIRALPDGYDTVLGARGDTLSGGQRQRIAIARAFLRDAPIVILDEATTGLDPQSAAVVRASLRDLTRGRTTLTITHDAETIAGLDRILWIEDGRIVEDGAPATLLADPRSRVARWVAAQEPRELTTT